ncbi:uncharacterized protein BKA78DRAFT_19971 [Phyllosticta capitalensis]|uniref:uncharacterized protein n=1 Tax=Phyllosticta capitalensis TaxID=121624 RepID=UPI00312CCB15
MHHLVSLPETTTTTHTLFVISDLVAYCDDGRMHYSPSIGSFIDGSSSTIRNLACLACLIICLFTCLVNTLNSSPSWTGPFFFSRSLGHLVEQCSDPSDNTSALVGRCLAEPLGTPPGWHLSHVVEWHRRRADKVSQDVNERSFTVRLSFEII